MLNLFGPRQKKKSSSSMGLLMKGEIERLIQAGNLTISPLLDKDQLGHISVDLRIGTDFLTCQQGRNPFIDGTIDSSQKHPIKSFFTETRRHVGEHFLFHPSQITLFSTLEYIKLPSNVFGVLSTRSSYSRLGLSVSTILQPGYCGCVSVEINYSGNTPVRVTSGARFIQLRLYKTAQNSDYFEFPRKYVCQVRPIASKANEDKDLIILQEIIGQSSI